MNRQDELKASSYSCNLKSNLKLVVATLFLSALLALIGQVQATVIHMELNGTVTSAEPANVFDLNVGDGILATATYDDAGLTGVGIESIVFGPGMDNYLSLYVGSIIYDQMDDVDYGYGAPALIFENGILRTLSFVALDPYFFGAGDYLYLGWTAGTTPNALQARGIWHDPLFHAIAEPRSLMLLGWVLLFVLCSMPIKRSPQCASSALSKR